jgi:two-component system, NtrC family, sensor kinase
LRVKILNILTLLIIILSFPTCQPNDRPSIVINPKNPAQSTKYAYGSHNITSISGDSIGSRGILLNKGWKFKLGDNIEYSKVSFDDANWVKKDIDEKFSEFKINDEKIGWFRKKIAIDSSMIDELYELKIVLKGAVEIYLNGELINKFGEMHSKKTKSKFVVGEIGLPFGIDFKNQGEQVIAIRYLFEHQSQLSKNYYLYPLDIRLKKSSNEILNQIKENKSDGLVAGICGGFFFMMCMIHFIFFSLFRSQRFNLLFSLAMLLFGISFYINGIMGFYDSVNTYSLAITFEKGLFLIGHIVLLSAVYEYLHIQKKGIFWIMIIIFIGVTFGDFFHIVPDYFESIGYLLLVFNYLYIIYKSASDNNNHGKVTRNAFIIFVLIITVVMVMFLIMFTSMDTHNLDNVEIIQSIIVPLLSIIFAIGPQLSISGSISYSLAKEYVKANISLKEKLKEVEILSSEKQEILFSQNERLEKEVNERTAQLNNSISELKTAQAQLIQSEKMASLGELTAGIAHEIKNPLNFVNNFSELNEELISEINEEIESKNFDKAKEILVDVKSNLAKITSHGKRADSIVKSMLEHSRTSSGKKEMIDINQLVKEYFNLAYHGTKAKNKTFNCKMEVSFNENLSDISVVPQDIGRVILNIATNAFYAVDSAVKLKSDISYQPTVSIATSEFDEGILITIRDNGTGIPAEIKAKIFQPFFTTKPTGEGTGLGLSLVYDIVKAHSGNLEVNTQENEYTEFVIYLPC